MKACQDCRHFYAPWGYACDHPALKKDHPIYGSVDANPETARDLGGECGPEAKFFEPKVDPIGLLRRLFGSLSSRQGPMEDR